MNDTVERAPYRRAGALDAKPKPPVAFLVAAGSAPVGLGVFLRIRLDIEHPHHPFPAFLSTHIEGFTGTRTLVAFIKGHAGHRPRGRQASKGSGDGGRAKPERPEGGYSGGRGGCSRKAPHDDQQGFEVLRLRALEYGARRDE